MTIDVIRGDAIKCCVVIKSWLGHALLCPEDKANYGTAVQTLGCMLAHVAYVDLLDTALPEILRKPMTEAWNVLLYPIVSNACSSYFAARIAAELSPDADLWHREIFLKSLEYAMETIPARRLEYRSHADLHAFLRTTVNSLNQVLVGASRLIGHCDGSGRSFRDDEGALTASLTAFGLNNWIDVLRRDLRLHFDRMGTWKSLGEFTAFNVHAERLLWQFGIFPWQKDNGEVRVEIPLSTDVQRLLEINKAQIDRKSGSNGVA